MDKKTLFKIFCRIAAVALRSTAVPYAKKAAHTEHPVSVCDLPPQKVSF